MFKCYRQIEHSDCGLTCIKMIARHYGMSIPLNYLHSISDLNRLGMSIKDITVSFNSIGMNSSAVRLTKEHIANMPLPAILYWQQRHFVVLYKHNVNKKKYYVADPAQGKLTYNEDDFLKYWLTEDNKGLAVLAEPTEVFYRYKYPKENSLTNSLTYLLGFFKVHKWSFLLALLITILIMVTDFIIPILIKKTIDEGIALKDINLIITLLLSQFAITLGGLVASNGMDLILTKSGLSIHMDMVNTFLERLAKFPLSFFDRKVSSDFVQKISDHSRIKDFLLSFPNTSIIMLIDCNRIFRFIIPLQYYNLFNIFCYIII